MTAPRSRSTKRPRNGALEAPPARKPVGSVRWSKILSAQARIASGYYERDEIQDQVVDALLAELEER